MNCSEISVVLVLSWYLILYCTFLHLFYRSLLNPVEFVCCIGMLPNAPCTTVLRISLGVMLSCPQAMTYKLDFEQERSDREEAMGRFDEERQTLQESAEKLNEKMMTMHLEHDDTLSQLEQLKELSLAQKEKVRNQRFLAHLLWFAWPTAGASLCVCMCVCCVMSSKWRH